MELRRRSISWFRYEDLRRIQNKSWKFIKKEAIDCQNSRQLHGSGSAAIGRQISHLVYPFPEQSTTTSMTWVRVVVAMVVMSTNLTPCQKRYLPSNSLAVLLVVVRSCQAPVGCSFFPFSSYFIVQVLFWYIKPHVGWRLTFHYCYSSLCSS